MEGRNKGLVIFGTILLAIGLFASFYQVKQFGPRPSSGENPGGPLAGWQIIYPYQNVGIILLIAGIIFVALGFLYSLHKTRAPFFTWKGRLFS
jgi:hypothetical protein